MTDTFLTITPLGGLGEIGMNCQMWNTPEGCVLVDCGIMFPDDQQLGVDVVIPPLGPILAQRDRLLGVVLTHGHEDHIGAVPWLVSFVKGLKVYGSPMTLALVEHKLRERGLLDRAELITVTPEHDLTLGGLRFHFIPVSHSIPQGYALAVDTPVGKVVHTGDFKIDEFPSDGVGTDLPALRNFAGADGVRLLLSDSTNAESEGHTQSEKVVRETFHEIFSEAKGRIVITLFSSHIERIQMVFDMAREFDRAVVVSGRSLVNNIERARDLGFMRMPPELFTDQTIPDVSPERMVVIATGSQGEPLSALSRIASGEHRQLSIMEGDTVIMSSRVIPGNARAVNRLINQMYRMGADVCHDGTRPVHVSGHGRRDELRTMLDAVRPKFFVPIHGEYRHLIQHRDLARDWGIAPERTFILDDGEPLTLLPETIRFEEKIPADSILVDGKGVGDVGNLVLRERQLLGGDGVVVVVLVLDEETGEVIHGPDMISKGFVFEQQFSHLLEDAKCLVLDHLETSPRLGIPRLGDRIRSSLRSFFRKVVGRDPVVVPVITEV
ncbi:ribonuclease J [uncultured Bilophila sp.]|uniref:ribonuclease J n=1 Tax=uncultured Bilophila sp. TaxID=529385 RepID=UPI00280A726F|nr:ribonuclease J [uncultured Bilophila sp.]